MEESLKLYKPEQIPPAVQMGETTIEGARGPMKAALLGFGKFRFEDPAMAPRTYERSTAGPGAGTREVVFSFLGARVKLEVSDDPDEFLVYTKVGNFTVLGKKDIVRAADIVPVLLHCPGHAFVNLGPGCIHDCAFCGTPGTSPKLAGAITEDRLFEAVMKASHDPTFEAVAVTSGVVGSAEKTLERMERFVKRVRTALPDAPIGVEPYVEAKRWARRLHEAGADEIKINVETATEATFKKVCPGRNRAEIMAALAESVEAFGKDKVTSNIILGLGEEEHCIQGNYEELAGMGVVPNLRPLKVTDANRPRLLKALGVESLGPGSGDDGRGQAVSQAFRLGIWGKGVLKKNNLTTLSFKTMCFPCQCCDLVPFRDV